MREGNQQYVKNLGLLGDILRDIASSIETGDTSSIHKRINDIEETAAKFVENRQPATISAAKVKEVREHTGEGMMRCKKALYRANGNVEKAIADVRSNRDFDGTI